MLNKTKFVKQKIVPNMAFLQKADVPFKIAQYFQDGNPPDRSTMWASISAALARFKELSLHSNTTFMREDPAGCL